tara:strand:+ start:439 stop:951 length:513 start_codon:yes stop_codon:yes gene_type:complete
MNKYEIDASIKEKAEKLNEFILTNNKSATKRNTSDFTLIAYIKEHELIEYKCRRCKNDGMWHKKPLPLIIDRIDSVLSNNTLENLRFLCPNCYVQLRPKMTLFKNITKTSTNRCIDCNKVIRNRYIKTDLNKLTNETVEFGKQVVAERQRCNKCLEKASLVLDTQSIKEI